MSNKKNKLLIIPQNIYARVLENIKNKDLTSSVVQGLAEIAPGERRRRRRGEKSPLEIEKRIEPKIIPYPLPNTVRLSRKYE